MVILGAFDMVYRFELNMMALYLCLHKYFLLMYPNRITSLFYDYETMTCPFILIFSGINVGPPAATTFQVSRIYSYP